MEDLNLRRESDPPEEALEMANADESVCSEQSGGELWTAWSLRA